MNDSLSVLMITSEWPSPEFPRTAPFIVQQVDYLRQAGVNVEVFHFRGAKNPLNYVKAWVKVRARLRSHRFDLIHAQWGQSALLALPKSIPLVVTFRGDDVRGIVGANGRYTFQGRILQFVSRFVLPFADQIIVVSSELAQHLTRRCFSIIPSGLDLNSFRPLSMLESRRKLGLPEEKKLVLFTALLRNPRKRYGLAKQAVDMLADRFDVELVQVSDIPHESMPDYMNACDVLLLTSSHEGSPNVVKEALACNLPVVSTDVGDVRERIGNIEGCEVCADDRPETIAAALERVLARGQRINGRQAVLELDERLVTQKVIQVYQQAIEGRKRK